MYQGIRCFDANFIKSKNLWVAMKKHRKRKRNRSNAAQTFAGNLQGFVPRLFCVSKRTAGWFLFVGMYFEMEVYYVRGLFPQL